MSQGFPRLLRSSVAGGDDFNGGGGGGGGGGSGGGASDSLEGPLRSLANAAGGRLKCVCHVDRCYWHFIKTYFVY